MSLPTAKRTAKEAGERVSNTTAAVEAIANVGDNARLTRFLSPKLVQRT